MALRAGSDKEIAIERTIILGLCGSLRRASVNRALLRAAVRLAPPGMELRVYEGLGALPLFNPDLEVELPPPVADLHRAVASANGLLIASPEYAHGVTGTIKNALDWLVAFEPFVGKPVAVLNASPRAHHADAALRETLHTMSAYLIEEASVSLPLLGSGLSAEGMVETPAMAAAIVRALAALQAGLRAAGVGAAEFPF
jgi:chromate reductase, NAD(P)H dehydrogenase (quinone)